MYNDKGDNGTVCKKLTKDMLFKAVEELCCGKHNNTKKLEPIIIISNGLTDKQIDKIIKFGHGFR